MEMAPGPSKTNPENVEARPGGQIHRERAVAIGRAASVMASKTALIAGGVEKSRGMFYLNRIQKLSLAVKAVTKLFKDISKPERLRPKMGDGCFSSPAGASTQLLTGCIELAFILLFQALLMGCTYQGNR